MCYNMCRRNVGCMKLLDLFEEIEEEMAKKGRSYLEHITPRKQYEHTRIPTIKLLN